MLQIQRLSKAFGRVRALDTLSVTLRPGQVVALIGPNGAGKSTLLKCILGLVRPDAGELTLDGESLVASPAPRRRIGYMPQSGHFPDQLRVGELFELMRALRRDTCERVDDELIHALEVDRVTRQATRTLSGGTRQKVSACLAFLFDPDVLILDEPTAGLDPVSVEILKDKIRAARDRGKLVVVASHILSDLDEIATDVLYLMEGHRRLFRPLVELKAEAGETRLERVVARLAAANAGATPRGRVAA